MPRVSLASSAPRIEENLMGSPRNEGEGNKTADRNYRKATTEFVESERGQQEIANAGNVSPQQEKDIRRAEEQAKQRAKEHDPAELAEQSAPGTMTRKD
jgi:hypothetical protein